MVTGPLAENTLLLLHTAIQWWVREQQFRFIDLPWIVPTRYTDATRPPGHHDILTRHGAFVASGEQSFLQLWTEGRFGADDPKTVRGYVGWTPCVRDERVLDDLHQYAFVKAEWFVPLDRDGGRPTEVLLLDLLNLQQGLFAGLADLSDPTATAVLSRDVINDWQQDILLNGIEVGSYGLREFQGRWYFYGTALALPRFTYALAQGRA